MSRFHAIIHCLVRKKIFSPPQKEDALACIKYIPYHVNVPCHCSPHSTSEPNNLTFPAADGRYAMKSAFYSCSIVTSKFTNCKLSCLQILTSDLFIIIPCPNQQVSLHSQEINNPNRLASLCTELATLLCKYMVYLHFKSQSDLISNYRGSAKHEFCNHPCSERNCTSSLRRHSPAPSPKKRASGRRPKSNITCQICSILHIMHATVVF
jgi:hypothetical protein